MFDSSKEKQDKTWTVPDWIPLSPACLLNQVSLQHAQVTEGQKQE